MNKPLSGIPANLVVGPGPARRRVIEQLLSATGGGIRWAVLDNDASTDTERADGSFGPDAQVGIAADGCICCNAVGLRVALTRLLRESRPDRLLVLPSSQARIPEVLRLLADRWLAPVLDMRATIAVLDAAGFDVAAPIGDESPVVHAQVIALEVQDASEDRIEVARLRIGTMAPQARLVMIRRGTLGPRLLDEPGPLVRPRFIR